MADRTINFSAGPCTLPLEVLEEAQSEFVDYHGAGMSLIEMSHRGAHYDAVHQEALQLTREVAGLPDDFEVLFVQGGASLQFAMAPMNLLATGESAAFAVTGAWAEKAVEDAGHHGDAYVAWDGAGEGYARTPSAGDLDLRDGTRYLHICTNETIGGIRFPEIPQVDVPLVGDVSSEFLSRPLPWDRFDLVFGGVQKNLGPAGMAVVFVRKSVLESGNRDLAAYLRYDVHASKESLYNTPPVFTIWMTGKVLKWMQAQGGLAAIEAAAERKAALVYDVIDGSDGYFRSPVDAGHRSVMNVVWRLPSEDLEAQFLKEASAHGMSGLKGHRSVGGLRASIYNAMPESGVQALADLMRDFADRHPA